jgi:hypothetical protein
LPAESPNLNRFIAHRLKLANHIKREDIPKRKDLLSVVGNDLSDLDLVLSVVAQEIERRGAPIGAETQPSTSRQTKAPYDCGMQIYKFYIDEFKSYDRFPSSYGQTSNHKRLPPLYDILRMVFERAGIVTSYDMSGFITQLTDHYNSLPDDSCEPTQQENPTEWCSWHIGFGDDFVDET